MCVEVNYRKCDILCHSEEVFVFIYLTASVTKDLLPLYSIKKYGLAYA